MSPAHLFPDLPAYVDLIVLRGSHGEIDMFARNSDGVHVPVTQLDPRNGYRYEQRHTEAA